VAIIGAGRMGGALAIALSRRGYEVAAIASRSPKSARALAAKLGSGTHVFALAKLPETDLVLLTTPDDQIAAVAEKLAKVRAVKTAKPVVLHTSGSLSSEVLAPLAAIGCAIGSMHPLASVSTPEIGVKRFRGAYFCIEGERRAQQTARAIVALLKGRAFSIDTKFKPLYHTAAVMTSGHTTALFSVAVELLAKCGLSHAKAQAVLFPLLLGTAENLRKQSPAEALTGTFARADIEAFERHLKLLGENADQDQCQIYLLLAKISLQLAEEQGADPKRIKTLRQEIARKQ
jgi:predicted short-subunit dehydrogenase-like oxidoreductase (DUF2520 family)